MRPRVGQRGEPTAEVIITSDSTTETETATTCAVSWRDRGRRLLHWLSRPAVQWTAPLLGLLGTLVTAIVALHAAQLPGEPARQWWFALPASWYADDNADIVSLVFYLGLAALTIAWFALGVGVWAGRWRIRHLWAVGGVWALPWLIGPPALSNDLYTYLGQGLVLPAGHNPYTTGAVNVDLPASLEPHIPSIWLNSPSPYGPGFTGIDSLIAPLARHDVTAAIIVVRLVVFAGLALAAVCLPRVARFAGVDPATATWIGVTSPLALGAIVLSGHNDGLMLGLVVAALALFTRREWRFSAPAAVAVATCAMTIKAPAVIVVGVLAFAWAHRSRVLRTKIARVGMSVGVAAVVTGLVSVVTTLGLRWINPTAMSVPSLAAPHYAPLAAVARAASTVAHRVFGFGGDVLPASLVLDVLQPLGVGLAFVYGLIVLVKLPKIGEAKAVAMLFTAAVIIAPVLWPWYLTWPVLMLGATLRGKWRAIPAVFAGGALFLSTPAGATHDIGTVGALIGTALVLALTIAAGRWIIRNLFHTQERAVAAHL